MQPETKFKNRVLRWFKKLRADGQKLWWVKLNDRTTEGLPDLLIIANGTVLFIELKAGENKATPLQINTLMKIYSAGGIGKVIHERDFHMFQHIVLKFLREGGTKL